MNNVGRLWAIGVLSRCLVPGPGMVRAGGYWRSEGQIQEVVRDVGFALVSLYVKGVLPVESFAVSRNELDQGSLSRIGKPFGCQSILKYRK